MDSIRKGGLACPRTTKLTQWCPLCQAFTNTVQISQLLKHMNNQAKALAYGQARVLAKQKMYHP